jgi:hypothetical protein
MDSRFRGNDGKDCAKLLEVFLVNRAEFYINTEKLNC